ncbi:MAG: ImmA/IrrE family metallo-endopeptidase [Magnetococcales bacterium]|nr:ImmA/IrrE family metallo-endopeptidase [Magnetococcales bacterium]
MDITEASGRTGYRVETLRAWESGEIRPSLPQIRKLAEVYKRPLAIFYFPAPPSDFSSIRDYRRLPFGESEEFSPELAFLIRQTQEKQQWIKEYQQEVGIDPLEFVGSARPSDDPVELATRIRQTLNMVPDDISHASSNEEALSFLITNTEEAGVFIIQAGSMSGQHIPAQVARGFVLADKLAPFIFLNAQDSPTARLFTLGHELVHLWLGNSGVSNLENNDLSPPNDRIETFCNRVAAELLVPWELFSVAWKIGDPIESIEKQILLTANHFKVSREVIVYRLLHGDRISRQVATALVKRFREEWLHEKRAESERRKESDNSPPVYHPMKLNSNGRAFSRAVISAYGRGELSGRDTSRLLNLKLNHLPSQAKLLRLPLGSGTNRK